MEATARQGEFKSQKTVFPPPADIPSGQDDDVVARQIRVAAMIEPDNVARKTVGNIANTKIKQITKRSATTEEIMLRQCLKSSILGFSFSKH